MGLLVQLLGREPTSVEVAGELGCETRAVDELLRVTAQPVSLDRPTGEGSSQVRLGDLVEDRTGECPLECASDAVRHDEVQRVLRYLRSGSPISCSSRG